MFLTFVNILVRSDVHCANSINCREKFASDRVESPKFIFYNYIIHEFGEEVKFLHKTKIPQNRTAPQNYRKNRKQFNANANENENEKENGKVNTSTPLFAFEILKN